MLHWIESHQLKIWNAELAYGKPTFLRPPGSSIIDIYMSTNNCINPTLNISDNLSLGSNHKMVHFSFDTASNIPLSSPPQQLRRIWRLSKIKDPAIQDEYKSTINNKLQALNNKLQQLIDRPQTQTTNSNAKDEIEILTEEFYTNIYTSLDHTFGRTDGGQKRRDTFWTAELQRLVDHRELCYQKWRSAFGLNKMPWWLRHQEASARVRRALKKRNRETWHIFCKRLETDDYTKTTATIKKIRQKRTIQHTFSHQDGPLAAANQMAQHLENVFDGHLLSIQQQNQTQQDQQALDDSITPMTFADFPITEETVSASIDRLPRKKAPGTDHLRSEMLKPIVTTIAPVLHKLFYLCWISSYTPTLWRIAQIVPIFKKGDTENPANYRPISLTSVVRKIFEYCLQDLLQAHSPDLDIAQGGFRPARSALGQAFCLQELCRIHQETHGTTPTLAFLDIKSAYDTVDREVIWNLLSDNNTPYLLLSILKNLFNDVLIEVIISNSVSHRFSPTTGVLQGSILSPFLYSLYINSLPTLLRRGGIEPNRPLALTNVPNHEDNDFQPTIIPRQQHSREQRSTLDITNPPPNIQCLLYADDVVLISTANNMQNLLNLCQQHSLDLGYRWNPIKCAIVQPANAEHIYQLYETPIPNQTSFTYLGMPINNKGYLDAQQLITRNSISAINSMRVLNNIGLSPSGFSRILSSQLYAQFIRPKLEYGLAILIFTAPQLANIEKAQNQCIRMIYGAHSRSETKIMRHLTKLPSMSERIATLQVKFVYRAQFLPDDALLTQLLPGLEAQKRSYWSKLCNKSDIVNLLPPPYNDISGTMLKTIIRQYLVDNFENIRSAPTGAKLLCACLPKLGVDPIMWIPMTNKERSRCIRWRLGWLPGGRPKPCQRCPSQILTKKHAIHCLRMHHRLPLPSYHEDPLSHILNQLPKSKPTSLRRIQHLSSKWPIVCKILAELDAYQHPGSNLQQYYDDSPGQALVKWITPPSPSDAELTVTPS